MAGRLAAGLADGDPGSVWPRGSHVWEFAGAVGMALVPVALGATVLRERSLQQVMSAREEERRRLRRDLHDGLGPALAALSMRAEAVQELVRDEAAKRLLDEIVADAQAAVTDIRGLVDDLRPPVLDSLGLVGALRALAGGGDGRPAADGPAVLVRAPEEPPPLPAATETAAYRIAAEALANARRHAAASRVWITLEVAAGMLHLEVADDGRGIGPVRPGGVGLTAMRERAAELGGVCVVVPRPRGGTLVRATLPATEGAR